MRSKVEIEFAKALKNSGISKFTTNDKSLPSTPDLVFHEEKLVVFFNGCYWHSHHCRTAKHSHQWTAILQDIRNRDLASISKIHRLGYETLVVWECEWRKSPQRIIERVKGRLHFARPRQVADRKLHKAHLH